MPALTSRGNSAGTTQLSINSQNWAKKIKENKQTC